MMRSTKRRSPLATIVPLLAVALMVAARLVMDPASASGATGDEAGRRVALVIGNGAYVNAGSLPNPPNDGREMAEALRRVGFEVMEGIDLDRQAMEQVVRSFARTIRGSDVALLFYAGHGLQVAGVNYLVPIDATLEHEADLPFEAFNLDVVLHQMEQGERTNLIFLDACRDNPLARSLARSMGATRSAVVGRGLARIESGIGTLIAYATQPDNVALDGQGDNSPFTTAILTHIDTPGLEVRQLLTRVRQQVIEETDRRQVPWDHSSLTGEFYFVAEPPEAEEAAVVTAPVADTISLVSLPPDATELMFWEATQAIARPEQKISALERYIERFPEGQFTDLAAIQIVALQLALQPAAQESTGGEGEEASGADEIEVAVVTPPPTVDPATAERQMALSRSERQEIQEALTALGFATHGIDGVFGPNTRSAIRSYQRVRGIDVTGYVNAGIVDALINEAFRGGTPATTQTPDRTSAQIPPSVPASVPPSPRDVRPLSADEEMRRQLALLTVPPRAAGYGVIALGTHRSGTFLWRGMSWQYSSEFEARRLAMQQCAQQSDTCEVLVVGASGDCVALAWGEGVTGYGVGKAHTLELAERLAMEDCVRDGGVRCEPAPDNVCLE